MRKRKKEDSTEIEFKKISKRKAKKYLAIMEKFKPNKTFIIGKESEIEWIPKTRITLDKKDVDNWNTNSKSGKYRTKYINWKLKRKANKK